MAGMNPTGKRKPKRRHHGEGSVVKRTDRWRARPWAAVVPYVDSEGRRRETWLSAASRAEAEKLRRDELARIRKGIVPTDLTVGQYVMSWLGTLEVGPGTWPTYKAHVTERIAPTLGAIALDRLTPQAVRVAAMQWKGAPATRAGTLRLLRAAMRQAVTDHAIEYDPTAGIPYPKATRKRPVTLTGAQARSLMELVKGERFAPVLVVSLGLGIRRGEALGLRTRDIIWEDDDDATSTRQTDAETPLGRAGDDPVLRRRLAAGPLQPPIERPGNRVRDGRADVQGASGGVRHGRSGGAGLGRHEVERRPVAIRISKSLRYIAPELRAPGEDPYRLTATKTGDDTTLPLPGFVAVALRDRLVELEGEQRAARTYAYNDFVFCDEQGGPIPVMRLARWWTATLKRAGLPKMRWHDIRASTATVLIEARILRHRDIATTLRYIGQTPESLRGAADKLEGAMG